MINTILATLALLAQSVPGPQTRVCSPDGKLAVDFILDEGKAFYSVTCDGITALEPSPLGFTASLGDFSQGLELTGSELDTRRDCYTMDRIKKSSVDVTSNVLRLNLTNPDGQSFTVVFNVSDNNIAYRYEIPCQPDRKYGKKMSIRIMEEQSGFDFPEGTTTFLTPQSKAMIGWKRTKPSYEEDYCYDAPMSEPSRYGKGYTFPALFHVGGATAQKEDDLWVLVSETGNDSRYCGCRLSEMKGDGLYTIAFPMPEENNGNGTSEPAFALPGATPWRTITVGTGLKPIVETTVAWDYVQPRYESAGSYSFGKSAWHWIVWQDDNSSWDNQVAFIDLAARMGYPYALVDAGWDQCIGYERMPELVQYARSKGVELFLWYSSSGWWNDIQQSPVNVMSSSIERKKDMRWMRELGVKGIKVDFFGGDKQETFRLYEQILSDADDNGLMVIFHGCTLPRGWERMYPNYVGSEAVLASENIAFEQKYCDLEATVTALHPFCRNTVGCMEFGGSFLNRHIRKGNKKGKTRMTTDAHEMAQAVLFQNPIQNFAITPENFPSEKNAGLAPNDPGAAAPQLSIDFLRDVPTTWDETVFIDGYPGKYCVIARRHGGTWYIAGNNATGGELTLSLDLPMLEKGETVTLYSDNLKDREPQRGELKVKKPSSVKVSMADRGGFVIIK